LIEVRIRSFTVITLTLILIIISICLYCYGYEYEFDVYGIVTRVVDGDTFYLKVHEIYSSKYAFLKDQSIKVRLADINAPELNTQEGVKAKKALTQLIHGKYLYLDIDDIYIYDKYGRIIAVAYLPLNKTHALNINKWLLMNKYAAPRNYPNEFNPNSWNLYIEIPITTTSTTKKNTNQEIITITALISILLILTIIHLRRRNKYKATL